MCLELIVYENMKIYFSPYWKQFVFLFYFLKISNQTTESEKIQTVYKQ